MFFNMFLLILEGEEEREILTASLASYTFVIFKTFSLLKVI